MALSTDNRRSTTRSGSIIAGAVLALVAVALLVAGTALVAVHTTKRDDQGFYASGAHRIATPTHALVSDDLDVGTDGPDWLFRKGRLGTLRVTATGTSGEPVFVGVARTTDVDRYLRNVAHDEIDDFELDPFSLTTTRRSGTAAPPRPAGRAFWAASATGSGRQSVSWDLRKGNWAVVVMNADARAGVRADVTVGAKVPIVLWVGIAVLSLGGVLSVVAGAAVYSGVRQRVHTVEAEAGAIPAGAGGAR